MGDKATEIVGGVKGEFTVTLGWFPSMLRAVPPPFTPDMAEVVQVAIVEEDGAVAAKVNTRLFPVLIVAPPVLAVRFMIAVSRL